MARRGRRWWGMRAACALPALWLLCATHPAAACGGFFCSVTPIDQTAERILFTINGDGTISAYVQIQYAGERDAFAWVVPVPSVPDLGTFPRLAFQALDLATQPTYRSNCGPKLVQGGSQLGGSGGVIVYKQQAVGPFQTVTLGGDSADELVSWLQQNGYRVSDRMLPFINFYVRDHMLFLAMKLLPDADVSDIEPVVMTYSADEPMIPLRLTAVAAKPEIGVLAFILADRRYGPRNYADLTISDDLVSFDELRGRNNYLALVSREVDRAGGHAFVTEYAHATSEIVSQLQNTFVPPGNTDAAEANDALVALLQRFTYITRLYTRISPEEMTVDPVFVPASSQVDVSNIHDSTLDDPCQQPPSCTFGYCGTHGRCLPVDPGTDGCYCDADSTAMVTPTFGAQPAVYCEPLATDVLGLGGADEDAGPSPCREIDCGQGTCTLINGNPTCQCTPGHLARVDSAGSSAGVRCVSQASGAPDAGLGGLMSGPGGGSASSISPDASVDSGAGAGVSASRLAPRGGADCHCSIARAGGRAAGGFGWPAVLAAVLGLARRRRRRARARRARM